MAIAGKKSAVLTFIPVLVVASMFGLYVAVSTPQTSVGTTTTSMSASYPIVAQTTNSTIGLKLELSINSTRLGQGQGLSINITEYNTLDKQNNVSTAKDWGNLSLSLGPCGSNLPVGASIFQGYYTPSNISSASALSLFAQNQIYACPVSLYVQYYLFQPTSDYGCMYVLSGNGSSCFYLYSPGQLYPISGSLDVSSYWDQANSQHDFSPGVYTVVGGDEWGQIVILHFVVSSKQTINSSSVQSNTETQATCTTVPAISYLYCPSPLRISAVGSPGATPFSCPAPCGSWNFTATINSTSVVKGQSILLWANLTNLGPNETFNQWIGPYINPMVTNSAGVQVWAWDPPAVMFGNFTVKSGETISQDVDIPTAALIPGQSYFISVTPLSLQFPTPNNYTFTFEFSVK